MATRSDPPVNRDHRQPRPPGEPGALPGLPELLDLVEDYLTGGFRRAERVVRPAGRAGRRADAASEAPAMPHVEAPRSPLRPHRQTPSAAPGAIPSAESQTPSAAQDSLAAVAREVAVCQRCALHRERKRAVPGEGADRPAVLVVGEGPGADEDRTGRPFVGAAGQYLDKWLQAVDLSRERNCFIANVVKCRPPGNRDPLPEETAACLPFLERQIRLLAPRAILCVGRVASRTLLGRDSPIGSLRGRVHDYRGLPLVPTYHPSAVLRSPDLKRPVWEDLKRLKLALDSGASAVQGASTGSGPAADG